MTGELKLTMSFKDRAGEIPVALTTDPGGDFNLIAGKLLAFAYEVSRNIGRPAKFFSAFSATCRHYGVRGAHLERLFLVAAKADLGRCMAIGLAVNTKIAPPEALVNAAQATEEYHLAESYTGQLIKGLPHFRELLDVIQRDKAKIDFTVEALVQHFPRSDLSYFQPRSVPSGLILH